MNVLGDVVAKDDEGQAPAEGDVHARQAAHDSRRHRLHRVFVTDDHFLSVQKRSTLRAVLCIRK